MSNSCLQCKFLFTRDTGWSNYTVLETELHCVLKLNPKLPAEIPDEVRGYSHNAWMTPANDKWHATKDSRCGKYQHTDEAYVHIDCDGDDIMGIEDAEKHFFRTGDAMPLRISKYFDADYVEAPDWMKP